jgi:hypothetical protein
MQKDKSLWRKPGRGAPAGRTKADVMIFLGTRKKTRQEILDYARSNLHIREKRGVDRHLSELLVDQPIHRIEEKKGFEVTFELDRSYDGYKRLFEYFLEKGRVNDFLETPYSQSYIDEEFLNGMTSDVLYRLSCSFFRLTVMDEKERADDPIYKGLVEMSDHPDLPSAKPIMGFLKKTDSKDVLRTLPSDLSSDELRKWKEQRIDEAAQLEIDLLRKPDMNGESMVLQYRCILFPSDEIDEILAVLRCSPSAMVLMMSISSKENTITGALITNLFILVQDILKDQTDLENLDAKEYSQRLKAFSEDPKFKQLRPTPILQLVRAMAIADIFAGNTLNGEWADGFLKKYLGIGQHSPIPEMTCALNGSSSHG